MKIRILCFGSIADITGKSEIEICDAKSTDEAKSQLENKFPKLREVSYVLAVDKKIISHNSPLNDNATIALLPPFSGG